MGPGEQLDLLRQIGVAGHRAVIVSNCASPPRLISQQPQGDRRFTWVYTQCIMRITISVSDQLLAAAKEHARLTGRTLGQFVEAGIRRELNAKPNQPRPEIPVFDGGSGPQPGVDLSSNRALYEALDEGTV